MKGEKQMVEIKGFNETYANAQAIEKVKKLANQFRKRKIDELVAQGIDRQIASVMFDTGLVH